MKKTVTRISIALCSLCLLHAHIAYSQVDTAKARHSIIEDDSEDDSPQPAKGTAKKKASGATFNSHPKFGVDFGINIATYDVANNNDPAYTYTPIVALRFGCLLEVPVIEKLFIEPGIFWAMNGTKASFDNGSWSNSETISVNAIEVPLTVMFKSGTTKTGRFFVGVGAYAGYNFLGLDNNSNATLTSGKLDIGSSEGDRIKTIDGGMVIQLGYEFKSGFFLKARYQHGFVNLSAPDVNPGEIYTKSYGFETGRIVGRKKRKAHPHRPHKDDEYIDRRM